MLDSTNAYEKMIADDITAAVIEMEGQIRWHDIIYTDWLAGTIPGSFQRPFHFHIPGGGEEATEGSVSRKIRSTRH